jgi:hypothetical protein
MSPDSDTSPTGIPRVDDRDRHIDFHSLRYTFCLWMSKHFPIEVVSKFTRHGTITLTVNSYLDLAIDREEGENTFRVPPSLPPGSGPTTAQNGGSEPVSEIVISH